MPRETPLRSDGMTAVETRIRLEELGGALRVVAGRLQLSPPPGGLPDSLRVEIDRHRAALIALVSLFPCRGCGRTQGITPIRCTRCATIARRHG